MSNSYHAPEPDDVRLFPKEKWVELRSAETGEVLGLLFDKTLAHRFRGDKQVALTYYGGPEVGLVVTIGDRYIDPAMYLIDEYGELCTIEEIKKMAGAGKKDEPGEHK